MITYKGDKFVKGKKFKLGESVITFVTKTNKGYIFEADGNKIVVKENIKDVKEITK